MAATREGRRLTEAHRLAQARLGAQTVAAIRAAWSLLDPEDLDGSIDRWLAANTPIVRNQRNQSAQLAANYLRTYRSIEIGGAPTLVLAESITAQAVQTSLAVTGPVRIKQAMTRGVPLPQAVRDAEASVAGAAMRHAMDGGRDTIMGTVRADRQALGWARATSGDPCAFCAMLASRGFAYKEESTAAFESHDNCSCTAEPTYRRDAALPPGSERFREAWEQAQREAAEAGDLRRGTSNDALNAFRRHLAHT